MSHLYFNEESDYSEENTVLGQLPQSKIAPSPNSNTNPKPNPNPDRGAVFLGDNCPDTGKYMWKWSISLHHSPPQKETKHIHASAADVLHTVRNIYIQYINFPVNLGKFLGIPFLQNTSGRLALLRFIVLQYVFFLFETGLVFQQ